MATAVPGFPNSFQTEYARIPKTPLPGDLWEGELFQERPFGGLIPRVTEVAYTATVTIGNFNATDIVGVYVNGGLVIVTATTDATATAVLLAAAINNAAFLDGVVSATSAAAVVTVTGVLGEEPVIVEYSPATTTATVAVTQAAVVQQKLLFGYGVVRSVPSLTTNRNEVVKPTALTDQFAGVLVRTRGGEIPPDQILAAGYDPNYLLPGNTYCVMRENAGVVVEYVGADPTETDPVYLIMSGANAGLWASSDQGTSEVVTLTITSNATDTTAFNYDGLPTLSITSTGTAATDAASLYTQWLNSAAYAAIGTIVDNLDGTLTITFSDTTTHTFTDASTGASSIAEAVDTAAVAATGVLMPRMSWGLPSIPASADLPARAFLRLSNP